MIANREEGDEIRQVGGGRGREDRRCLAGMDAVTCLLWTERRQLKELWKEAGQEQAAE